MKILIDDAIDATAREIALRSRLDRLLERRQCSFCRLFYRTRIGVWRGKRWYCEGACAKSKARRGADAWLLSIIGPRPDDPYPPTPALQADNARRHQRQRQTRHLLAAWMRGEVTVFDLR